MKNKIVLNENNKVKIEYSFDKVEFEEAVNRSFKKNKGRFSVHGFRKGKAPRKMIEMSYGKEVFYEDAVNFLINDHYDNSIDELDIKPISQPEFDVKELNDEGVIITAELDVEPEVKLGEYKDLEIEKEEVKVSDEDVDKVLEQEIQKNARMVPSEEAAKEGDFVTIKVLGEEESQRDVELGANGIAPEVNEALIGSKVGDKKEIKLDEEEPMNVEVLDIKFKELPELDDDFIMDISEFDTVDEYKKDLKEKMLEQRTVQAKQKFEYDAIKKAIENMEVEIPEKMIENYQNFMLNNFKSQITSQGISFDDYLAFTGMDENKIKEDMKETASFQAREKLLIDAVIDAEKFEVSEEDIDSKIEEIAKAYDKKAEEVKDIYKIDNYRFLREDILKEKARNLITSTAKEVVK